MATDAVSVCPDHNLGFSIEVNASDYQLGAVVKQNGRPVVGVMFAPHAKRTDRQFKQKLGRPLLFHGATSFDLPVPFKE